MGHAASAKRHYDLTGLRFSDKSCNRERDARSIAHLASVSFLDGIGERLPCDPGDGLFAGSIDVEHLDGVRVSECRRKLGEKVARAGVAMRLKQ